MISSPHRPTVIHVDLEAITYNIHQVQSSLNKKTKTFAVVKANAYGHGAVAVSRAIESQVDGFCVSNLDEALELREAGIKKSILVLGVLMPEEINLALEHDICLTIASLEWLDLAERKGIDLTGLSVHLKVDSGMGRIGFRTANDVNQALAILEDKAALVEGIFTHFATADEASKEYFDTQLSRFKTILTGLDWVPEMIHASNSATSLWHKDTVFNAVRLGLVIYGLNPSGTILELPYDLKPALSLESELVHVKVLSEGEAVGYGASYRTTEEEVIGTIPIGYADGWTRDMQGFCVLVDGESCPIVGRVSMDQITVSLPKVYPLGTKVTLIGTNKEKVISATAIAEKRGTINYEVLCLLSDRIPRDYL